MSSPPRSEAGRLLRGMIFSAAKFLAVAERMFAEGWSAVCLLTDLANPVANRCDARMGFKPVCDAVYIRRIK